MLAPLEHIYSTPIRYGYVRQIFVLTDGEVDDKNEIQDLVKVHAVDHRIFAIGISDEVDRAFIELIASNSGGDSAFVIRGAEIKAHAKRFFAASAAPSIVKVQVTVDGVSGYSMVPHPFETLFLNAITYLFLRKPCHEQIDFTIHITGQNGTRAFDLRFGFSDLDSPIQIEKFYGDIWMGDYRILIHNIGKGMCAGIKLMGTEVSRECGVVGPFTGYVAKRENFV
jgi:hypothetical protein